MEEQEEKKEHVLATVKQDKLAVVNLENYFNFPMRMLSIECRCSVECFQFSHELVPKPSGEQCPKRITSHTRHLT